MTTAYFEHSQSDIELRERGGICVAYLSTYPPRQCGLADFCQNLVVASDREVQPLVVAMENGLEDRQYRSPVAVVVQEREQHHYEAAAQFLNDSPADVVSIQHEFGIFGGPRGPGLQRFLKRLTKPAVTTLHTVVPDPDPDVRSALRLLAEHSYRLVLLNPLALDTLTEDYQIERRKLAFIHHGASPPSPEIREQAKARLGLSGRRVLSTFGLVGRGKGLEYVIAALPEIRKHHPEVCYVIVGQTHPGVHRVEKERYRGELSGLAQALGVADSVRQVNRYVTKSEIMTYLAATDVYVTPYLNPHQVSSGTLTYAVAAGKAIVSTPYLCARFLLGDGRGLLVDFRSEHAIADAANQILDRPTLQQELETRTRHYGQWLYWPAVASQHVELLRRSVREHRAAARPRRHVQLDLFSPTALRGEAYHEHDRRRAAPVSGSPAPSD
jgi:glycosyltransferase involved in cell wall biosynthesis